PVLERGARAVIVVPAEVRPRMRDAFARALPDVQVLADEDVADEERVEVFACVGGGAALRAA
ncbi:MAG: hypothetical protein EBX36_03505, partial [Planctomycetia bacterium]|nr:hypothetical protein [Planctomycetia bacterium]